MNSCQLYLDNLAIGRVVWEKSGSERIIRAGCGFESGMIYRVYISDGQTEAALGVMEPQGERFALRRAFRQKELSWLDTAENITAWVTRSRPGEDSPPPSRSQAGGGFAPHMSDALLKRACDKTPGVSFEGGGGQTKVCYPLEIGGESAFAPFFAVTSPVTRDGQSYGCITLDSNGKILPAK